MKQDLCDFSTLELLRAYREKKASPVEVAAAVMARIEMLNPDLNAFSVIDPDVTVTMARASESRWQKMRPLGIADGIPTTIKDGMATQGWPSRGGSLSTEPRELLTYDCACVARLREAGSIFVGKTATSEFASKGVTNSPLHGATRNPWSLTLGSGGSSGGAGVAAALGLGTWHAASDAAGSIRIPSAFCGVFGFKPSYGTVPLFPSNIFSGLSHHGAIARTVPDVAAMMSIITRSDVRAPRATPPHHVNLYEEVNIDHNIKGWRIGYHRGTDGWVDPEIDALVERAVAVLEDLGAHIEETHVDFADARDQIEVLWRVGCALLVDRVAEDRRILLDPNLREMAERGREISAREFRMAQLGAEELTTRLQLLCSKNDLLLMPTVPIQPFQVDLDVPPDGRWNSWIDWNPFTYPFNLSQQPAMSVPCGLTQSKLPAAFQIAGARFTDSKVLRAARAYELACPMPVAPGAKSLLGRANRGSENDRRN